MVTRPGDVRAVRVALPDGSIRAASEYHLERVGPDEFGAYAAAIGVALTARQTQAAGRG